MSSKYRRRVPSAECLVLRFRCLVPGAWCLLFGLLGITATATATDDIFRAMEDELQRSMNELQIGDLPKPYHIEYLLTKRSRIGAHAILGIVDDVDTMRSATLTVRVPASPLHPCISCGYGVRSGGDILPEF